MNAAVPYAPVHVDDSTLVGQHCVLAYPRKERLRAEQRGARPTRAGDSVWVGADCLVANHVVVYEGVHIGPGCVIEDRVRIGYNARVGSRTRLVYGAYT